MTHCVIVFIFQQWLDVNDVDTTFWETTFLYRSLETNGVKTTKLCAILFTFQQQSLETNDVTTTTFYAINLFFNNHWLPIMWILRHFIRQHFFINYWKLRIFDVGTTTQNLINVKVAYLKFLPTFWIIIYTFV